MKIGILTYHRSHNYGALLQAMALRHVLAGMGHDVHFVDYWPRYHKRIYSLFSLRKLLSDIYHGSFRYTIHALKFHDLLKKRIENFKSFINANIVPYCVKYGTKYYYDVLIYGSDQIWRKQPVRPPSFNPVYFGDNPVPAERHVAYAPSMGEIKLSGKDKEFLKRHLCKFQKLSVREDVLKKTLQELGFNPKITLDPTLLLDRDDWERILPTERIIKGKYILYYRLLTESFDEKAIERIAEKLGYEFIILDSTPRERGDNIFSISSPYDFLSLIKYSECVYTSSYHGTVFSLIFNKPFYSSFKVNARRAEFLLDKLGLTDRLLKPNNPLPPIKPIDYDKINDLITTLRIDSLHYLKDL